jgi:hypothetical protein
MKPARPPLVIDRIAAAQLRGPRAAPLLDPGEAIACGLNYAMQFEFWKREITEDSMVVHAITEALRIEGYKIVPMERKDYGHN